MSEPSRRFHAFEKRAMGSPLRLSVVGIPAEAAADAWHEVSDEIEAAEQALSRFRETSDLTVVNRAAGSGMCAPADRRLGRALAAADRASRLTDGRFDARVLADLERLGYAGAELGGQDDDRADARSAVEPQPARRWLIADPRSSRIGVACPVDLGGIGKGLALRWAWRRIERAVLERGGGAMLEAGGDLVAGGPAPQAGPWVIAIEDPSGAADPVATVALPVGAVATSSILVHRWTATDGRSVHHLVDPRTGRPGGAGLVAVTVAGSDPAWSEVWSKSLFLCGADGIAGLARARGLAAWWVRDDGRLEMTAAGRARTTWVAAEA
ncbi:MAG: FAD:protein FMN transferase [Candidatus Limnocylindrales bacterium]